jgi:ATP-dependent helicase HrpA
MKKRNPEASVRAMLAEIRSLLPRAMLSDRGYVRQRLDRLQKRRRRLPQGEILQELADLGEKLSASEALRKERALRAPRVSFPPELPITAHAGEIIRAIKDHPVIIISGETGSGKSTQIPKMCLLAGRGVGGKIACTQPRRIAAITIAHRIAFELRENLGRSVGYKIRFRDKSAPENFIKIVTDGMLLAETQSDPQLWEYDTLIIDEAHERSLNIDFLLGIARTLLDTRPELKLIITSATLDTEKFVRAFRNAPVIEVSGRQYPVEVEYRPAESFSARADEQDYVELAVKAVELIKQKKPPGDILVFMPTEQDILETCEKLAGRRYAATTVLPLYARLPGTQQGKVYHVKGAKIVVATNVAETSLTIPGIRYVVDTGLARIAQYQPGTRINSLPVSPIARSSADQRKGRCGRVRDGVCIRLYAEKDYLSRPAFTPPEILRSNLAEVILRMIDLRLGHPAEFAFVDRPKSQHIKDGYDTLLELGAIRRRGRDHVLTEKGRLMARMPLDPKISRMLLEARAEGCLREVAVIAASLSIRDPRERPPEEAEQADAAHRSFRHPDSDFLTLLNIWDRYHSADADLTSRRRQRRFCRDYFLSFSRVREWVQIHDQIQAIFQEQRILRGRKERDEIGPQLYAGIHRSILSGYLSHIAVLKEKSFYTAAKGRDVMVFPGSTLFGKSRPWIVAAEMVRTSRLFARTAARIDPGWLEDLGGGLCRYSYSGARWEREREQVVAEERVRLFGLEIVSGRRVSYARIRPEEAHEIFVRSALVEGDFKDPPVFLEHNLALIRLISQTEEKLRRRGLLVGEDILAEFYSRRLPGIADARALRKTIREQGGDSFLKMQEADILQSIPDADELSAFPDRWRVGDLDLPVTYRFAPGEADDGVTLKVPVSQIRDIPEEALEWGVPGQFREWITALVKGLPKRFRKLLVPIGERVEIILKELEPGEVSLYETLARLVKRRFGADIPASAWAEAEVPAHLRWRIAVVGPDEKELGASRDLPALKRKSWIARIPAASEKWTGARRQWERRGLKDWDFDALPESISIGPFVNAFPGLAPAEGGVDLRLFASRQEAVDAHRRGVKALLLGRFNKDFEFLKPYMKLPEEHATLALYFGGKADLEKAMIGVLHRELLERNLRTKVEFQAYAEGLTRELFEKSHILKEAVQRILSAYHRVRMILRDIAPTSGTNLAVQEISQEIRREMDALVPRDFVTHYSLERLGHIPRYLDALGVRAERGRHEPARDRKKSAAAAPFVERLRALQQGLGPQAGPERRGAVERYRWMVEEYKVSLFAPEVKTAGPVSAQRLTAQLREIESLAAD